MHEVQEVRLTCDPGPGTATNALPERILEDSDGVARLYYCDEPIAWLSGVEVHRLAHPQATWIRWRVAHLTWMRPAAFRMLQGASLQQLVGNRYVIATVVARPPYHPLPGVDRLELCELVESAIDLTRRDFFDLIHSSI